MLHPRRCLLSFPTHPRDKEALLGVRGCSQLQPACTFLRGVSGETLHLSVLWNAAPACHPPLQGHSHSQHLPQALLW